MAEPPSWTLGGLAALLGAELDGPPDLPLARPVEAGSDDPSGITFAENEKYARRVRGTGVGAVIVPPGLEVDRPALRHPAPRLAFFQLLHLADRPSELAEGVHPRAEVHPTAVVEPGASVGAYAVVGPHARISPGARVYPLAYVGDRCVVGPDSQVMPHAVLVRDVALGARCLVHPGAVLGADGFGFVWDGRRRVKIPQVGGVVLGDDVEVGANACADRATAGATRLDDGVKIDNLVQIGHNVRIREHAVVAGHTGISGSADIGRRAVLGGNVGIADHARVGDDVVLAARAGVFSEVSEPGEYYGVPPVPVRDAMRQMALVRRLGDLFDRVKTLEAELSRLKEGGPA